MKTSSKRQHPLSFRFPESGMWLADGALLSRCRNTEMELRTALSAARGGDGHVPVGSPGPGGAGGSFWGLVTPAEFQEYCLRPIALSQGSCAPWGPMSGLSGSG